MAFPLIPLLGAAISGLGSVAGAAIGSSASDRQTQASIEQARRNEQLQREFAQNGIQWRVEDAKKAGISPVAALGGGGASFSPISVGVEDGGHHWSRAVSDMGQDISRAVKATASTQDRQTIQANELKLENMRLENALLSQRLTAGRNQTSQIGPAMPVEPTIQPEATWHKTQSGGVAPAPSEAFADRAEDQWLPQIGWAMRNMFLPEYPKVKPAGWPKTRWYYNPAQAEWVEGNNDTIPFPLKAYDAIRRGVKGR